MLIFYKESHRDVCTLSIKSQICSKFTLRSINDMVVAVKAAKQGVPAGKDTVSGFDVGA